MALLKTGLRARFACALRLRCLAWIFAAALPGAAGPGVFAQSPASSEYQLKAVFLFNFAQFVEWPASAFVDARAPLVIGVLGEDPFGTYLDEAVRGERIGDRPLVVRRYARVEDVGECHILFISRSESGQIEKIVSHLKGRSLLTVGDAVGFIRKGGILRFVTLSNKIRLRINVEKAKNSGLTISSKLLRRAEIVTTEGEGD